VNCVSNFGWTFFGGGAFDLRLPILFQNVSTTTQESSFGKSALVVLRFVALKSRRVFEE